MANKTLGQIAEIVHRSLDGSDIAPTSRFDYREVLAVVQSVYAELMSKKATADEKTGITNVDGKTILAIGNQVPALDTSRNEYKVVIEQSWITLPYNHGLFQISDQKNQSKVYIPIPNGARGLMAGLSVDCLELNAGYYVEGNSIFFHNGTKVAGSKLLIKIISSDEDSLCCDELQRPVMEYAFETLRKRVLGDNINDNTARAERETPIK